MRIRRRPVDGRSSTLVIAGTLAAGVLVACGGSEQPAETDLVEEFTVHGALAEVPALGEDDAPLIHAADLRRATELAGLEYPSDGSREAVTPWLMSLTGAGSPDGGMSPVFVPMPATFNLQAASPDEFADLLGFSILDADRFVEASAAPRTFATVVGDVSEDTLADDLVEVGDAIWSDSDADDLTQALGDSTAASRLGVPVRVAGQEGRIAVSTSVPLVKAWLDDGESLADDAGLSAVAEALDERDAVSATLTPVTGTDDPLGQALGDTATPEQLADVQQRVDPMIPAEPFDAVGIGWSVTQGDAEVHAAYHFGTDDAAAEAVGVLETAYREGLSVRSGQPFSDRFTVQDAQADGPVVVVTVSHSEEQPPGFLQDVLLQQDVLFVSR
ncbi:hypothetical protein [Aeromicrobium sp. CTD01-1L150]|uniref:hypothetical protein n=1 Tax=Aeromicrobium sp. CTD01-1L150 TaxID=3341830 RepID=UPI0035C08A2D